MPGHFETDNGCALAIISPESDAENQRDQGNRRYNAWITFDTIEERIDQEIEAGEDEEITHAGAHRRGKGICDCAVIWQAFR